MKWIQSTGGPLILMANDLVAHWRGCHQDYDRACEIDDWLGMLDVKYGKALVLGDDPMPTALWAKPEMWLLVRWLFAPSEDAITEHLEHASQLDFADPSMIVAFESQTVTLFDSSAPGSELDGEDSLQLKLPAETCEVFTRKWQPDQNTKLILHSFRPV